MNQITRKELESIAQLWCKGGCYFQDFIKAAATAGYDIKNIGVCVGREDWYTIHLVPKGMYMPVDLISVFK